MADLLRVDEVIPPHLRSVFNFTCFNRVQSSVARQVLESNNNMVIAAPTGSGKTALHELAVLRLLMTKADGGNKIKAVYIAPNKALGQERHRVWSRTFGAVGLQVLEVTGDSENNALQLVAKANIIITTPEKWDALTRSWRQNLFLFGNVDLLLLDEVHFLGEDRGPVLETVVVRMRLVSEVHAARLEAQAQPQPQLHQRVRIVALSATLPNLGDIGDWLQCDAQHCHYFDDGFRPVPLTLHTLSYGSATSNLFLFEKNLDERVPEVVKTYSGGKQTLIFCSSKKGTETLAKVRPL